MANLRIMSNNVWCTSINLPDWVAIGADCSAQHRSKGFVKTYMETKPDVIDMQECTSTLADFRVDDFIDKYNCPAIIVGDFNAPYSEEFVQSAFARGHEHCHDISTGYKDEKNGCHQCDGTGFDHNENPATFFEAIDHILIKNKGNCEIKCFDRFYGDYYMCLSDHFPVWCDIEF